MTGTRDLESINQKLKSAGVRLRLVARNHKLYIRGTLPPRPGQDKAKQTYLALGLDATPYGLKMALAKSFQIWADLSQGKFTWDDYSDTQEWDTVQAWIDRYKKHWLLSNGDTQENCRKWHKEFWLRCFKWLPPQSNLTAKLLEEAAQSKLPNTRSRQRMVRILINFAKFANLNVDLQPLLGNYSSSKVQRRDIPSDKEIAAFRDTIKNKQWQLVYIRMAVYGLRDHECWLCEINDQPPYACQVLDGKTGARENVMPLYPEWAQEWKPWAGSLPTVNAKGDHTIYGERTSRAFKRQHIPFCPYNLRHAYAIRGSVVFRISVSVMARMMGHAPEVHLRTYNRWISAAQNTDAYLVAINHTQAPKAP